MGLLANFLTAGTALSRQFLGQQVEIVGMPEESSVEEGLVYGDKGQFLGSRPAAVGLLNPGDIRDGLDRGDGILGTRVDCPEALALLGTVYGDPADPLIGELAYNAPTAADPTALGGWLRSGLELTRIMLAHCATFRAWTNTGNAGAALERIHLYGAAQSETAPLAIVDVGQRESMAAGGGGGQAFAERAGVAITFEPDLPNDKSVFWAETVAAFVDSVDAIVLEMLGMGENTVIHEGESLMFPTISTVELIDGPLVLDPEKNDAQYVFVRVLITFAG